MTNWINYFKYLYTAAIYALHTSSLNSAPEKNINGQKLAEDPHCVASYTKGKLLILTGHWKSKAVLQRLWLSVSLLFRLGAWFCCLVSSIKCQRTDQCYAAVSTEGAAGCTCAYEKAPWVKLYSMPFSISVEKNKQTNLFWGKTTEIICAEKGWINWFWINW